MIRLGAPVNRRNHGESKGSPVFSPNRDGKKSAFGIPDVHPNRNTDKKRTTKRIPKGAIKAQPKPRENRTQFVLRPLLRPMFLG